MAQDETTTRKPSGKWGSIRDVAAIMGCSVGCAERYKALGRLPRHVELSAQMHRWDLAEIEAWMDAGAPPRTEWEARKKLKGK